MVIDDMFGADLQTINAGNMKKMTIAVISQKLNEHAYHLCSHIQEIGE